MLLNRVDVDRDTETEPDAVEDRFGEPARRQLPEIARKADSPRTREQIVEHYVDYARKLVS